MQGKGSVSHDVPVPGRLSAALLEWKDIQESFKGQRIKIAFATHFGRPLPCEQEPR
jgi:hypothetical protein